MFTIDHPEYKPAAKKIVSSIGNIITAVRDHGQGTMLVMTIAQEAIKMTQVSLQFVALPKEQRDEFFAEIWDEAIGMEDTALVKQLGPFDAEATEYISDGMKAAFLTMMNRVAMETEVGG